MRTGQICGRCGAELIEATSSGYCPSCLLRDALDGAELAGRAEQTGESAEQVDVRVQTLTGAGQRFGDYELLEKIGQGGMGVVYKARQLKLDRKHYFSMDFIEGQTLAEVVREKPLPANRAAACLKTIAEAVHYAHERGILHRDLKPSNILIDRSDQPRITDFGLAKRLTVDSDMTLTGQVLGSPNFMAPEQADGRLHDIGPATEVYSPGALLYHLVTRQPPFQADTLTTLLKQVIEKDPVPPRLLNPSLPRDLETICLKCLEKEPRRRYPTAHALALELGRLTLPR